MNQRISKSQHMEDKLRAYFSVQELQIENQSERHQGHSGDDGSGESHYKITISSLDLNNINRVEQHRKIFQALGETITKTTHSISIKVV